MFKNATGVNMLVYLMPLMLSQASRSYIMSFCRETLAILSFGCYGNYMLLSFLSCLQELDLCCVL